MPPICEVEAPAETAVEVLTDGFYDNPLMAWVFPDFDTRLEALSSWFGFWVAVYGDEARIFLTPDESAAALWAVPNARGIDRDTMPGFVDVVQRWNGGRTGLVLEGLGALANHPAEPYWYLNSIATRRGRRAAGLGAQLLEPMLERADAEHAAVYLESSNPRNLTFYVRYGFEPWGECLVMPESDARVQPMLRPAR